jgi:hypothetical protein
VRRITKRLGKGGKVPPFKVITPPTNLVKVARKLLPGRRPRSRVAKFFSSIRRRRLVLKKNK